MCPFWLQVVLKLAQISFKTGVGVLCNRSFGRYFGHIFGRFLKSYWIASLRSCRRCCGPRAEGRWCRRTAPAAPAAPGAPPAIWAASWITYPPGKTGMVIRIIKFSKYIFVVHFHRVLCAIYYKGLVVMFFCMSSRVHIINVKHFLACQRWISFLDNFCPDLVVVKFLCEAIFSSSIRYLLHAFDLSFCASRVTLPCPLLIKKQNHKCVAPDNKYWMFFLCSFLCSFTF